MIGHSRLVWQGGIALCFLVASFPLAQKAASAQAKAGGASVKPEAKASKAAKPRREDMVVVVRGHYRSESLRLVASVAKAFPSKEKLDIASDDYASFGRFCDRDDPFHVLIQEGSLTPHHETCRQLRFPAGAPQPEAFLVGQLRVVFVAHKENPVSSLAFVAIRKALGETGKTIHWQEVGGVGSAAVHCCGPAENTWVRQLLQNKCMTEWRDADQPGVRQLQRLAFRDDIAPCADAKEVVAKVRADRHALGFFAYCEPLTKRDLQGVKVLPIAEKEGDPAVAPPLDLAGDQG